MTMRVPLVETRYPDATRRMAFFQSLLAPARNARPACEARPSSSGVHPFAGWMTPIEVPGSSNQDTRPAVWFTR